MKADLLPVKWSLRWFLFTAARVPQGSINSIIMKSHYIREPHFCIRQPRALQQIIHTPQEYAKSYHWPIYLCQGRSLHLPPTHPHSLSPSATQTFSRQEKKGPVWRFRPGCSSLRLIGLSPSLRLLLSQADKAIMQRWHLSPQTSTLSHVLPNSWQHPEHHQD